MSQVPSHKALFSAMSRVLRPMVRLMLRSGVPYTAFSDLVKHVYVDVAASEFEVAGRKQTNSRIATITGLSRKEVQRVKTSDGIGALADGVGRNHRVARVVAGWVSAPTFRDASGQPAVLPFEGASVSFSSLVKSYSGDMPPRAVLDELMQTGVVRRLTDGRVQLLRNAYISAPADGEQLAQLGADAGGLLNTIERNLNNADPMFQRKVVFEDLSDAELNKLRILVARRGQEVLEEFARWMDDRPQSAITSMRSGMRTTAGVGVYYFEEEPVRDAKSPIITRTLRAEN